MPGMITAEQCVADALRAYDRGKRSVVPGRLFPWFMRATHARRSAVKLRVAERMYRPRAELRPRRAELHVGVVLERLGDRPSACAAPAARRRAPPTAAAPAPRP